MRKLIILAASVAALALAGTAAAALVPHVFDPGNTGCPTATVSNGVLHLAKPCATSTNAAAYGEITGVSGQPFTSASFTLASTSQCQGGSPRFNIGSSNGTTYFLGCNNVAPVVNADGTATYTFNAATIAAGGNQVPVPAGTITSASVLIDVQGSADVSRVFVNGQVQEPVAGTGGNGGGGKDHKKHDCPHGRTRGHDCGKHKGDKHAEHKVASKNDDDH
jgi:hypothetical protein